MAVFPTLSKGVSIAFNESVYKPTRRVSFEGNYSQTRPVYTRTRATFELKFRGITQTDITTLRDFFHTYNGDAFSWNHPQTAVAYTVRFMDDLLKFSHMGNELYETKIMLEEE